MEDIIIIGAGPAGLTSAIYALRGGKKVLLLEAKNYGGNIINANEINNYPGYKSINGYDFATNLYNQTIDLGARIEYEKVINIVDHNEYKEVITEDNKYLTKRIIIATGVTNKKINLPNEDELLGKGISYCATCDGALYKDKIVAVYGGGNTAVEDALFLSNYSKKVYLIYRKENLRADKIEVDKLKKKDNIEILYNSVITKINGTNKLDSVTINDNNIIDIDGLFIAIGQIPANNFNIIDKDDNNYIISDDDCHTNIKGIYVAGDVRNKKVRQLTTATSDGTIAALTLLKEFDN